MKSFVKKWHQFRAWIWSYFELDRSRFMITFVVFSLLALGGGILGFSGYRYVWLNPTFCYACHIHDYANEAWDTGIHAQVTTCHDCHQEGLGYYFKVSYALLFDRPTFPQDLDHAPLIPSEICRTCHITQAGRSQETQTAIPPEDIAKFVKIEKPRLHAIHLAQNNPLTPAQKINCHNCHGSESNRAHKFQASEKNCLQCHREARHENSVRLAYQIPCSKCHFIDFVNLENSQY